MNPYLRRLPVIGNPPAVRKLLAGLLILLFVVAVAFRSYATARGIPVLGNDARVFLPQVVPFHERGELINTVWDNERMTYHGFLYPMVLATLMWRGDYPNLAATIGLLSGVTTLLFSVLLWNFATLWRWEMTGKRLFLIAFLSVACAGYIQGVLGRPEVLATFFLTVSTILISRTSPRWHGGIAGVAIGLTTATDPMVGVFAGLTFAGYAAWRFHARQAWIEMIGAAALSVLVFASLFLWYPYPFADWLRGTLQMSSYALEQGVNLSHWNRFILDYFWSGTSWFLGASVVLVLWSGVRLLHRFRLTGVGPSSPRSFYFILVLSGVAFVRFILYVPWARYYIFPFLPLGFCWLYYELGRGHHSGSRWGLLFRASAFLIAVIASMAFFGDLFQRAQAMRFDLGRSEARALFSSLRKEHPQEIIALQDNLFTLTEDLTNVIIWRGSRRPSTATILVVAQFNLHELTPFPIEGFRLIANHFDSQLATVFGFPILKTNRGNGFAVYSKERPASGGTLPD